MPLTRQSLIDQAMMLALAGTGAANNPLEDDHAVVELLINRALKRFSERYASKPDYAYIFRTQQTVTFTNGQADVPGSVLSALLDNAELKFSDMPGGAVSKVVQWTRSLAEFEGWLDAGFYYGLRRDNKFYVKDATGNNYSGDLTLEAAVDLAYSALADLPVTLEDDLIAMLAALMRDFMEVKA